MAARVPTAAYHGLRFVSRHRWAVSGASVAILVVLGAAAWAQVNALEARRQQAVAQSRLDAVRSIASKVVFDYNRALEPVPGTLALRRTLVADALGYLDALQQEAASEGSDALLADVAAGFDAVGDVQGRGATGANLGDLAGAQRSYERAEGLWRGLCARGRLAPVPVGSPASAASSASVSPLPGAAAAQARSACVAQARTLVRLGDNAFSQGRLPDALPRFNETLALAERALAAAGDDAALRLEAQDARFDVVQRLAGVSVRLTGADYDRGLALAQTQLQAAQALVELSPGIMALENLRVAQDFMAARLLADGRPDDALPHVDGAIDTARRLAAMRPGRDATVYLNASLSRRAEIQAHRLQAAPARSAAAEALAMVRALHEAEPQDRHLRARLANVGRRYGEVNNLLGDAEALAANARELPRLLALSAVFTPAEGPFHAQHLYLQRELARTLLRRGEAAAAAAQLAELPAALPGNPRAAADMVEAFVLRARVHWQRGESAAAWARLGQALPVLQAQARATPGHVPARLQLAQARLLAASWLAQRPATAPAGLQAPLLRELARAERAELERSGQLSPWWQAALAAP